MACACPGDRLTGPSCTFQHCRFRRRPGIVRHTCRRSKRRPHRSRACIGYRQCTWHPWTRSSCRPFQRAHPALCSHHPHRPRHPCPLGEHPPWMCLRNPCSRRLHHPRHPRQREEHPPVRCLQSRSCHLCRPHHLWLGCRHPQSSCLRSRWNRPKSRHPRRQRHPCRQLHSHRLRHPRRPGWNRSVYCLRRSPWRRSCLGQGRHHPHRHLCYRSKSTRPSLRCSRLRRMPALAHKLLGLLPRSSRSGSWWDSWTERHTGSSTCPGRESRLGRQGKAAEPSRESRAHNPFV
jgi:hypothetical protein